MILSCDTGRPGTFLLSSLQWLPNASTRPAVNLRVGAGFLSLTLKFGSSFLTTYNNETFEVRQERAVVQGWVEAMTRASVLTVAEQPLASANGREQPNEASKLEFSVPATQSADVVSMLVAHCAAPPKVAARAITVPSLATNIFAASGEAPDSGWRFAFLPVAAIGSAAFATASSTHFDQMVLAISCGGLGAYTISTVQRLPTSSAPPKFDIVIGEDALGIVLPAAASSSKTWRGDTYDVHQSKWPRSVVEKLIASAAIAVRKRSTVVDPPSAGYSIPAKGQQDAFKALIDQCAMLN